MDREVEKLSRIRIQITIKS